MSIIDLENEKRFLYLVQLNNELPADND